MPAVQQANDASPRREPPSPATFVQKTATDGGQKSRDFCPRRASPTPAISRAAAICRRTKLPTFVRPNVFFDEDKNAVVAASLRWHDESTAVFSRNYPFPLP
jgi:hypothetical protein